MPPKSVRKKNESLNLEQEVSIKIEWMYYHFEYKHTFTCTASPKVMKIFSPPQTRNQSQVVQNDKLSRENVETKIFVGGNGTFSHVLEKN